MSTMSQLDFFSIVGKKLDYAYNQSDGQGVMFNFESTILSITKDVLSNRLAMEIVDRNAWLRRDDIASYDYYYPLSCFEDKCVKNVRLLDTQPNKESFEIEFEGEKKRLRVWCASIGPKAVEAQIIRPGFTVNFGNKSLVEIGELFNRQTSMKTEGYSISKEIREVYFYYSCVDNVFELANYIFEIFKNKLADLGKPIAYQLAKTMIYG